MNEIDVKLLEAEIVRSRAKNKIYVIQLEKLINDMKENNNNRDSAELELEKIRESNNGS